MRFRREDDKAPMPGTLPACCRGLAGSTPNGRVVSDDLGRRNLSAAVDNGTKLGRRGLSWATALPGIGFGVALTGMGRWVG